MGKTRKAWPAFNSPGTRAAVTVAEVLREKPGQARDAMIQKWVQSVWNVWKAEHENVAALLGS